MCAAFLLQMHNQAKASVASSLEREKAAKERKEQELAAAHQTLEETNKKLQVSTPHPLSQLSQA